MIEVARIIAKGPPPEWLVPALEQFGVAVEGDDRDIKAVMAQVEAATNTLMRWLPMWEHMPWGWKNPVCVQILRATLPEFKQHLDLLTKKRSGRPREMGREVCAAVVVEAWRRIHGKVEPRSKKLYEACKAYWGACGGKPIGETDDIDNWERTVKRLLAEDYSWIGNVLGCYETHIK
jgi:hypothetical protein